MASHPSFNRSRAVALLAAAVVGAASLALPWWSGRRFGASELTGFDLARIGLTGSGLVRGGLGVAVRIAGVLCAVAAPLALGGAVLGAFGRRAFGWLATLPGVAALVVAIGGAFVIGAGQIAAGIRLGAVLAVFAAAAAGVATGRADVPPH